MKLFLSFLLLFSACMSLHAEDYTKWMGRLPDTEYVANLSIPGAHDAVTGHGFITNGVFLASYGEKYSRTQDKGLDEQLALGVRAFDIRPCVLDGELHCTHGITHTSKSFDDAMTYIKDFLTANPTEFVIIHLLYSSSGDTGSGDYQTLLHEWLNNNSNCLVDYRRDLTVKDMRGKILFLYRDSYTTQPIGGLMGHWTELDWYHQCRGTLQGKGTDAYSSGHLMMQDLANTSVDGAMDKKKAGIKQLLDYSMSYYTKDPRQLTLTMNFLSAYSQVGNLLGNEISLSNGYRDNAANTNAFTIDYLKSCKPGPMGIVMMDYAGVATSEGYNTRGDELIPLIIENNFKYIGVSPTYSSPAVAFTQDADRVFTGRMGICGKNTMPIMADMNNDGLTDIYYSGETYITGWGDGAFLATAVGQGATEPWSTISNESGKGLPVIYNGAGSKAFDYNQDGFVDYLLIDHKGAGWTSAHPNAGGYTYLRLIKNNGDGSFSEVTTGFSSLQMYDEGGFANKKQALNCLAIADVNNDGYPEVIVTSESNNEGAWERTAAVYMNNAGEGFTRLADSGIIPTSSGHVVAGDFNNDGFIDLAVSGYANASSTYGTSEGNRLDFYKNDGTGHFALANEEICGSVDGTMRLNKGGDEHAMHAIDFDQDGLMDILIVGSNDSYPSVQGNGKVSLLLRNTTADGKFSFAEQTTGIWCTSGNATRLSALADFNGDGFVDYVAAGWGEPNSSGGYDWTNDAMVSYSTGNGTFQTVFDVATGYREGLVGIGDVDSDGMLDLISPTGDNGSPYFYRNTSLQGGANVIQVPTAPANINSVYDAEAKTLTLTWDAQYTASGAKAIYNVYIKVGGKTFMRVPALESTGRQTTYLPLANYLPTEKVVFSNIEIGTYEVGVQSVALNYNASPFTKSTVTAALGSQSVAVGEAGMATFCPSIGLDFSSSTDIDAYKAVIDETENMVVLSRVESVAKGEGVLIYSVNGGEATEDIPQAIGLVKAEDNAFVGTLETITVNQTANDYTNYVLSKEENVVGFFKASTSGTRVVAGKAYLPVPTAVASKGVTFMFDDIESGISIINIHNPETFTEGIYNLNGQRISAPQKGVNIINGKKVIVE